MSQAIHKSDTNLVAAPDHDAHLISMCLELEQCINAIMQQSANEHCPDQDKIETQRKVDGLLVELATIPASTRSGRVAKGTVAVRLLNPEITDWIDEKAMLDFLISIAEDMVAEGSYRGRSANH